MIPKAATQATPMIPACHTYVNNLVFVEDDVCTSRVGNCGPIRVTKPYRPR